MSRMAGSEGPKRKISVTLSPQAFDMVEEIAAARGGNYFSRIVEEAIRDYHARLMRGGLGNQPIKVRPSKVSTSHRIGKKKESKHG